MVENDEPFPCDTFLLSTSEEEGDGFIETAALDGEKNLKPKVAVKDTIGRFRPDYPLRFLGKITAGDPDGDLKEFKAKLEYDGKVIGISLE
jgi:magnesium-transporting ATPase (P-type)